MFLSAMAFGSFVIGTAGPASAAAGDLDPTFGGDGTVTTDFTDSYDAAFGIGVQPDGKIVVVGETASDSSSPKFAVARYNTDGALDDSFSKNGKRHTDFTDAEDFARELFDPARDRVPVRRTPGEGLENQEVERPLQQID